MRAPGSLPPAARAVLLVAATSLFMVLVAWATLIGPDQVFTGPGPRPPTLTTPTETCLPVDATENPRNLPVCEEVDTSREQAEDLVRQADPPLWLRMLVGAMEILLLVAIVGLVVFVVTAALRAVRDRRSARDVRESVDFVVLDESERIAEEMASDAVEQEALLRDGEPRNAIVAAWSRFEVQGERAGVGRRASETSSEYAIRILDLVAADTGAVNRLAGLYREARFSEHEMTEAHRAAAIEAFDALRRSLGART